MLGDEYSIIKIWHTFGILLLVVGVVGSTRYNSIGYNIINNFYKL